MPPFVPYLIGLVTAPLIMKIVKPLVRGTVKTTIELGLHAKKLAAEAAEDLQDLTAEASAELAAAQKGSSGVSFAGTKIAGTKRN